jgi:tetratricopeptide (TPR) repeat protein
MKFGVEAARRGLWREAAFRWEKHLKNHADNPRLRNNLGVAYESLGRHQEAIEAYRQALRLLPGSREIRSNYTALREFCRTSRSCDEPEEIPAAGSVKSAGEVVRVTLTMPVSPRVDMQGLKRILVTRFRIEADAPDLDLNKELVNLLRRELRKQAQLEVSEAEPPTLPEQPFAELLTNSGFWRRMAGAHGADVLLTGQAGFSIADRSGFVQQDEISPLTGQRVRRTRFVEREAFLLDLRLFLIRGATGALLYEDHFTGENTVVGRASDRLSGLYGLFEQMEGEIMGIVAPRTKVAQRFLFEE